MDATALVSLISSVGFPIIACIYMARWVTKQMDSYRQDIKDIQQTHKEEISRVTEALDNNTKALQELSVYIKEADKNDV